MLAVPALALYAGIAAVETDPCDAPDAAPWVGEQRDRIAAYNDLYAWATGRYGAPTACDGRVTLEFDGRPYGVVELTFAGGATLTVETMPLETSIVTLRRPSGFADPDAVTSALRDYADGVGVEVDWSEPTTTMQGDGRTDEFGPVDPAFNVFARIEYIGSAPVAISLSIAL